MKNKIKSIILAVSAAAILCANMSVFATSVPQKTTGGQTAQQQYDEETQKIIETITGGKNNATATPKPTKEPVSTQKASSEDETDKATATPKATAKATSTPKSSSKSTATPKATAKASSKATATPKATAKSSTIATVKPSEDDEEYENSIGYTDDDNDVIKAGAKEIVLSPSPDPSINVVTNQEQLNTKRYLTKGGAFGMFLLTVLVSAIISFLISYRFYKMNRTDSRVMAEIRALKRDIDTKMTGTVGGFSEHETRTSNTNPSYARDRAITRRTLDTASAENTQDMYAKWEGQIGNRNRTVQRTEERPLQRSSEYTEKPRTRATSRKKQTAAAKIMEAIETFINKK